MAQRPLCEHTAYDTRNGLGWYEGLWEQNERYADIVSDEYARQNYPDAVFLRPSASADRMPEGPSV